MAIVLHFFRRYAILVHRYLGLLLAVLLLISGLTGSIIVFSKPIDRALNPQLLTVQPGSAQASVDAMLARAVSAVPDRAPSVVYMPPREDAALEVLFRDTDRRAYLDPYTGALLGARAANSSFTGFLIDLHVHLLAGKTGEKVQGWSGLGAIVLALLGFWLWWPRRGKWNKALAVKFGAAPFRLWFDLHRVGGALAGLLIVLAAATGASLALPEIVTEPLLKAATGSGTKQPPPKSSLGVSASGAAASGAGAPGAASRIDAPLDAMLAQARARFPAGRVTRITLPAKPDAAVAVRMRLDGEIHQFGRSFLWFDRHTGALLRVDNALSGPQAVRVHSWLFPLHTGVAGGLPTQLLQALAGLALAMLSGSGVWLWWRKSSLRTPQRRA